jgi:hypothetical protein
MRTTIVVGLLFGMGFCAALCQETPPANSGPVQAELIAPLNLRRLKPGAKVFARVTLDWDGLGCTLRTGATLEANVEVADRRKGRSESRLALAFTRAQCNGRDLKPMNLLLAAVAEAPAEWSNKPNISLSMPLSFADNSGSVNPAMGVVAAGQFSTPQMQLEGIVHRFPMSAKVQPGDVIDIKGMKLGLGTGPNRSSVLTTKNRDVSLDEYTQLLLVPEALVYDAAVLTPSAAHQKPVSPPIPENDLEVCAPPGCVVDLPVEARELAGSDGSSIAVRPLGYEPRLQQTRIDFGDDDALAWLSRSQLLFAFNPHPLIRRSWSANSVALRRLVRAELLDVESRKVIQAVDWEITDTGRYLWPIVGNRILVHVGNKLRVYAADLELKRELPLDGPLDFIRISPDGRIMAIGILRERHSPELHARLRGEMGREPEEDVDIRILDQEFNTIARASTTSALLPPTLLNEGQVNLFAQPNQHYRLALRKWNGAAVTLARFASLCTPQLSSVAPDLLFLHWCSPANGGGEYRVLRSDGKAVLRGESGLHDTGEEVTGSLDPGLFAIKVVHAATELLPGVEFKLTDLVSEEVRVYRAADGKRLTALRVDEPSGSHGSFAVSPEGHLAVLSQSKIQIVPTALP